jgi:hypothetical protein
MLGAYIPWFVKLIYVPHAIGYVDINIKIHVHLYGMYDALRSPEVNPLEGSKSVVAESWDSEGAPGFQL